MKNIQYNQGVAIIMVLLIVAIATALASYIALQQNLWQRQVSSQFERAQARKLGQDGINFARSQLSFDYEIDPVLYDGKRIDYEKEGWNSRLPAIPVESGEVIGWIEDRQGLFNLNNVGSNMLQFQRLLGFLGLSPDLAPALKDWLDADNLTDTAEDEDKHYLRLLTPYRSANRPLSELGELLKVKGFDAGTIEVLRDYVTVLPASNTPINVNFAKAEVMAAVIQGLSLSDARMLERQRQIKYFEDVQDFKQRMPQSGAIIVSNDLTVETQYFWVTGIASVGQAQVKMQALMHRTGAAWPAVVWQSVQ